MKPPLRRAARDNGLHTVSLNKQLSGQAQMGHKTQYSLNLKKTYIVIGLLVLFGLLFAMARVSSLYSRINTQTNSAKPIPKEKKVFNMLLMGYGGPGHDGAYLTDTMMFASIDTEHKRVTIVSIPRDIWVEIPTEGEAEPFMRKINSAYQTGLFKKNYPAVPQKYDGEQGAGDLVKEILYDITGQNIDYYVAIDFSGFKKVVNTLDGVEVNIERPFTDIEYPIDGKEEDLCGIAEDDITAFEEREAIATESPVLAYPCRYETLQFAAGLQKMDGDTALKFVRSRHSPEDGGDFNRARRQQLFLEAVRDRVLSIGFLPKIMPLMNDLESSIRTDMPVEFIQRMLKEAPSSKEYSVRQVILTTDNYLKDAISEDGQYILISTDGQNEWKTFQADIKEYMQGNSPTPPGSLTPTGTVQIKSRVKK